MRMKPILHAVAMSLILGLVSLPVWADSTSDLPGILIDNLGLVGVIMQTLGILIGLSLFVAGMFQLKRYGEMRTMMSSQMSISGPLMTLLAGVAMLCSPLFMGTLLVSFWGPAGISDLSYTGDTTSSWSQFVTPVLMFVRLIGVYAFMRGFVMAAKTGSGHAQPGTTGKVLVHIFAGILCVHIMGTIQLMESIFGLNLTL